MQIDDMVFSPASRAADQRDLVVIVESQYHSFVSPSNLPGGDLIAAGLLDLERGDETIAALLVSIGAPRLRRLGFAIAAPFPDPEHRLYTALAASDAPSAHSRFNALVRRLVSFERAAECAS